MIRPTRLGLVKTRFASLAASTALLAGLGIAASPAALAETAQAPSDAITSPSEQLRAQQALAQLVADYEVLLRRHDPITAGMEGDLSALGLLPDLSRRAELGRRGELQALVRQAATISPDSLNHEGKLDLAYVQYLAQREIERINLDTARLGFDSEGGAHQLLAYLAYSSRLSSLEEAEQWLKRLAAAPALIDANMANTRRGLQSGLVQPRSVVESALGQARRDLDSPIETDVLMQPLNQLPDSLSAQTKADLKARAAALIAGPIRQARHQWLTLLQDEYLPKAPSQPGLVHRPDGRELYAFKVRSHTTTNITPEQVHAIGLEEVARIRALMEVQMRATGWTGSFADFLIHLRTDPQFYATSRQDLLNQASEIARRADAALPALFGTLPKLPYVVRPVPTEIEATYTTGRYSPGSAANGVAAAYLVNTGQLDQRPLYELPALTVHEAVPGHHLQIALQQEAGSQPYYRRAADVTAFSEGWGLYAEFLGEEMGIYRTPYEQFGRLSYEMWRACRLVADTGLHWYGWSEAEARACFTDNSALSPHNIETELQRYISDPGQATAYKIGEIRLKQLRDEAEEALGDRFDVRTFHDALLVDGPLPLNLLGINMRVWRERLIERQNQTPTTTP